MKINNLTIILLLGLTVMASGCTSSSPTGDATESPTLGQTIEEDVNSVSTSYFSGINGVDAYSPENNSEKKWVEVNATVSDGFFDDDYLYLARGGSEVFQKAFSSSEEVEKVGLRVYKTKKNDYGEVYKTRIGLIQMERSTYDRIQWDNFEPKDLKDVAQIIEFEGESTYLDLKESQEQLERSQERLEDLQDQYGGYGSEYDTDYGSSY